MRHIALYAFGCTIGRMDTVSPSPEEIAGGCAEIQHRWTPEERQRRSRHYAESGYRANPYVDAPLSGGADGPHGRHSECIIWMKAPETLIGWESTLWDVKSATKAIGSI